MNKPYNITKIIDKKDFELVNNLFTILFTNCQPKEHRYIEISGTGVVPSLSMLSEKEFVLVHNTTDGWYRLYTKISNDIGNELKYISLT